jgi:hypothetical protein
MVGGDPGGAVGRHDTTVDLAFCRAIANAEACLAETVLSPLRASTPYSSPASIDARADNRVLAHQPRAWTVRRLLPVTAQRAVRRYAGSRQDGGSRLNIVNLATFSSASGAGSQPNAGDNQAGLMAGVRHAF